MWPELKRKAFHLLGVVYVIALVYLSRPVFCALIGGALAAGIAVEVLRRRVPRFNAAFGRRFGGLLREEERHESTGFVWMLAGVLSAAVILEPVGPAAASILYLIFGDAAASLVGKRVRGPAWPGSNKRVAGSLACFIVCLAVGKALLIPHFGWSGVWAGAAVATAVELAAPGRYDNFAIPFASAVTLALCYGLSPL